METGTLNPKDAEFIADMAVMCQAIFWEAATAAQRINPFAGKNERERDYPSLMVISRLYTNRIPPRAARIVEIENIA